MLQVLERGAPYPQVILPVFGGYWIEAHEAPPTSLENRKEKEREDEEEKTGSKGAVEEEETPAGDYGYPLEEKNDAARAYRRHFLGRVRLKKLKLVGVSSAGGGV